MLTLAINILGYFPLIKTFFVFIVVVFFLLILSFITVFTVFTFMKLVFMVFQIKKVYLVSHNKKISVNLNSINITPLTLEMYIHIKT